MSIKRAIGFLILFAIFACIFAILAVEKGVLIAAIVFALCVALVALIAFATALIVDGG